MDIHHFFLVKKRNETLALFIDFGNRRNQYGVLITFMKLFIAPANIPSLQFLRQILIIRFQRKAPLGTQITCATRHQMAPKTTSKHCQDIVHFLLISSVVAQSCPTLCDPMNCSTPGLPVHHQLLEFTQSQYTQLNNHV